MLLYCGYSWVWKLNDLVLAELHTRTLTGRYTWVFFRAQVGRQGAPGVGYWILKRVGGILNSPRGAWAGPRHRISSDSTLNAMFAEGACRATHHLDRVY